MRVYNDNLLDSLFRDDPSREVRRRDTNDCRQKTHTHAHSTTMTTVYRRSALKQQFRRLRPFFYFIFFFPFGWGNCIWAHEKCATFLSREVGSIPAFERGEERHQSHTTARTFTQRSLTHQRVKHAQRLYRQLLLSSHVPPFPSLLLVKPIHASLTKQPPRKKNSCHRYPRSPRTFPPRVAPAPTNQSTTEPPLPWASRRNTRRRRRRAVTG